MDEDCRDPPETFDDDREHFDVIIEEGEAATTECRDDDGHEELNGGRVIIDGSEVFVDPLANECFVDVTETRDLPPPEPKQQNQEGVRRNWHALRHLGSEFRSFPSPCFPHISGKAYQGRAFATLICQFLKNS